MVSPRVSTICLYTRRLQVAAVAKTANTAADSSEGIVEAGKDIEDSDIKIDLAPRRATDVGKTLAKVIASQYSDKSEYGTRKYVMNNSIQPVAVYSVDGEFMLACELHKRFLYTRSADENMACSKCDKVS